MECIWPECARASTHTAIWPYSPRYEKWNGTGYEVIPFCEDHFDRAADGFLLDRRPS